MGSITLSKFLYTSAFKESRDLLLFYGLKDENLWKANAGVGLVTLNKSTVLLWDTKGVKYEIKLRDSSVVSEKYFSPKLKSKIRKIEIPE